MQYLDYILYSTFILDSLCLQVNVMYTLKISKIPEFASKQVIRYLNTLKFILN